MPELPEVETVRAGLEAILINHPLIKKVRLMRADVRFPIPKDLPRALEGRRIERIRRRAKYLLIDTEGATLLSHLGMTGSWRASKVGDEDKHDHCYIELSDGQRLAFRDPRRFGLLDLIRPGEEATHPRLKGLGVEPLDEQAFTADFLFGVSRRRKIAAKVFLMDQRIVVGIGNIYASEAFHRGKVRPAKAAGKLTRDECDRLVRASREVLHEAIRAGGSSISDYRQASGIEGNFQNQHLVYDRAGMPCSTCGHSIKAKVLGGRSTYWCVKCQK